MEAFNMIDPKKLEKFKSSTYNPNVANKLYKVRDSGRPVKNPKQLPKVFTIKESAKGKI